MEELNQEKETYVVGESAPVDGFYVCVPCGYRIELKAGDEFPLCIGCLDKKTAEGADEGLWELAKANNN